VNKKLPRNRQRRNPFTVYCSEGDTRKFVRGGGRRYSSKHKGRESAKGGVGRWPHHRKKQGRGLFPSAKPNRRLLGAGGMNYGEEKSVYGSGGEKDGSSHGNISKRGTTLRAYWGGRKTKPK